MCSRKANAILLATSIMHTLLMKCAGGVRKKTIVRQNTSCRNNHRVITVTDLKENGRPKYISQNEKEDNIPLSCNKKANSWYKCDGYISVNLLERIQLIDLS